MKTVTICSSASFYKHVNDIQDELSAHDIKSIVPKNARQMRQSGDYDVSHYKTWFGDEDDYHKKASFIREHFTEIERGDYVLVVNDRKHGIDNYIGGNVLMEMAIAFYLNKPIYILNDIPAESQFLEEIRGMLPTVLSGDLSKLPA